MTRVVLFSFFLGMMVVGLNLRSHKDRKVENQRFDFQKFKKHHGDLALKIEKAHKERMARLNPKKKKVEAPTKKEVMIVLDTPELKNGFKVYKSKCVVCHGKTGLGKKSQKAPKLAGQYAWYIEEQLNNMKSKKRINKVMDPYLKTLTSSDFKDISLYLEKFSW